mmetsp:Transcript_7023/g.21568  ORF Transcript_7023/g.21568 Transcript_7023/m.21568 type:complete len:204 (+) Transcript_7023:534-1145(+)
MWMPSLSAGATPRRTPSWGRCSRRRRRSWAARSPLSALPRLSCACSVTRSAPSSSPKRRASPRCHGMEMALPPTCRPTARCRRTSSTLRASSQSSRPSRLPIASATPSCSRRLRAVAVRAFARPTTRRSCAPHTRRSSPRCRAHPSSLSRTARVRATSRCRSLATSTAMPSPSVAVTAPPSAASRRSSRRARRSSRRTTSSTR